MFNIKSMRNSIVPLVTHTLAAVIGAIFMFMCFVADFKNSITIKMDDGRELMCVRVE